MLIDEIMLIAFTDFFEKRYRFAKNIGSFIFLGPDKWIRLFFFSYSGAWSMTRIYDRFLRQCVYSAGYTVQKLLMVASRKISATDAVLEKDISSDQEVLLFTVKSKMRRRMDGGYDHSYFQD